MEHPALPEMIAYIKLHKAQRIFRSLQGYSYYNLYYYLRRLCESSEIVSLTCTSGYRRRYCIDYKVKEQRKRLCPIIKYESKLSSGKHRFTAIDGQNIDIDFLVVKEKGRINIHDSKMAIIFDRKLYRHYIIKEHFLVAVIDEINKSRPRLPGPTYTYGIDCKTTEYEQCISLMANAAPTYLGVCGERRATA